MVVMLIDAACLSAERSKNHPRAKGDNAQGARAGKLECFAPAAPALCMPYASCEVNEHAPAAALSVCNAHQLRSGCLRAMTYKNELIYHTEPHSPCTV